MPIVAFHNLGNYRFEETTADWGTQQPGVHHAIAVADLDGDGDLDLIVNNLGSVAGIYRNESSAARVAVRLKGLAPNTQGIGAKIKLLGATVPLQSQEVIAGGRYMAGADTEAVFAPGNVADNMTLEVVWRTGKRSLVTAVRANRAYEIDEAAAQDFTPSAKPPTQPLFEDVSSLIQHVHQENEFNDFERQPGLTRKLSQSGPGVAWADVDGDGWDDLIMGSGKGGRLAIFHNDNHGGFKAVAGGALDQPAPRDQSGIVVWRGDGKPARVLAGSANYEETKEIPSDVQQYDPLSKSIEAALTNSESSIGPLALTDMHGDGNLDLFVGGRVIAGHYPAAASSKVYRHLNGAWQLDQENTRLLEKIGLVSGAVWSDLDGDGFPELILACEWGPIRIFHNNHGNSPKPTLLFPQLSTLNPQLSTLSPAGGMASPRETWMETAIWTSSRATGV